MPLLFAFTLFISAFLLFLVQPMIGKMILPRLGGTPAVWNTCMVFFQAALLAGYGYTHSVSTYLPVRRQLVVHGGVLLLPLLLLAIIGPFSIGNWEPPPEANPIFNVLGLLTIVVGLPFFVVATSAPLLQKWFGSTGHPSSKDPYFLYGVSNLGSMLALLAYPVYVEQAFRLEDQSTLWAFGYGLFFIFTVLCGYVVWRAPASVILAGGPTTADPPGPATDLPPAPPLNPATAIERNVRQGRSRKLRAATTPAVSTTVTPQAPAPSVTTPETERLTNWRRLRWVALAAVPSSLMLGVTTHITTDIAAVPLFWIVPLALYLLSFILVFMRWPVQWLGLPHRVMLFLQPLSLGALGLVVLLSRTATTSVMLSAHVLAFFLTVMVCHGELARDRPSTRNLTEFYLWMSVGGVVGGMFNGLVAPVVFVTHIEYFLVLVMSLSLRPPSKIFSRWFGFDKSENTLQEYLLDIGYAVCLGLFSYALIRISQSQNIWGQFFNLQNYLGDMANRMGMAASTSERIGEAAYAGVILNAALVYGIPVLICLGFSGRPLRFVLSLLFFAVVSYYLLMAETSSLYSGRSFFGVRRVEEDDRKDGRIYHVLIHGGINHGAQRVEPENKRNDPITYFHPNGPIGELFSRFKEANQLKEPKDRPPFGVIGLGIGTLASYSLPGQHLTFYEIDPAVRDLSLPPDDRKIYFYYLHDAIKRGVDVKVDIGDGRLRLRHAPKNHYQILVLDAFSSDAIPVHLLTLEALDLYLEKLAEDGVIIYNITNNYVDLKGVLADQARERGLLCLHKGDKNPTSSEQYIADWVILAPKNPNRARREVAAQLVPLLFAPPQARLALSGQLAHTLVRPNPEWPPLLQQLILRDETRHGWSMLKGDPNRRIWRDNYSNLLGVMTWDR